MEDFRRKSIKFQGFIPQQDERKITHENEKQKIKVSAGLLKTKEKDMSEFRNYQEIPVKLDTISPYNLKEKLGLGPVTRNVDHLKKKKDNMNTERTDTYVFDEKIHYRTPTNVGKNSVSRKKKVDSREKFECSLKEKLLVNSDFPVMSSPPKLNTSNKPKTKVANLNQVNSKSQAKSYSQIFPARQPVKDIDKHDAHMKRRSELENQDFLKWINDVKNSGDSFPTLELEKNEYQINYGPETVNFAELKKRGVMSDDLQEIPDKEDTISLLNRRDKDPRDVKKLIYDKQEKIISSSKMGGVVNQLAQVESVIVANTKQRGTAGSEIVKVSGKEVESTLKEAVSSDGYSQNAHEQERSRSEDIGLGGEILVYTALVESTEGGDEHEGDKDGHSEHAGDKDGQTEQAGGEHGGEQDQKPGEQEGEVESRLPESAVQDCQDEPCNEPSWFKEYGIDRANRLLNIKLDHTSEDELRMESIETQIIEVVYKPTVEVEKKEEIKKKPEKKKKPKVVCEETDEDSLYQTKAWVVQEEPSVERSSILLEQYGDRPCYARGREPCEEPCIQPPTTEASQYLKKMLGNYLVPALTAVALYRPKDPIEYLAYWILRERQKGKLLEQRKLLAEEISEMRQNIEAERMEKEQMKLLKDRALKEFNPDDVLCTPKHKSKEEEMETMGEEAEEDILLDTIPEHEY